MPNRVLTKGCNSPSSAKGIFFSSLVVKSRSVSGLVKFIETFSGRSVSSDDTNNCGTANAQKLS